jgi:hypothetical protein
MARPCRRSATFREGTLIPPVSVGPKRVFRRVGGFVLKQACGLARRLGALPNNPVLAAKSSHLTTREHNRLARQQARTAWLPSCCTWLHVVVKPARYLGPVIAAGERPH